MRIFSSTMKSMNQVKDSNMFKPCDICLEETCKGNHTCKCDTCKIKDKCYRNLSATIRITNRCTQECSHCCFESSPKSNIMMSVEMSQNIAKFINANGVYSLNLMGGEFFCNPDWFEIYSTLINTNINRARLVTNGDWVNSEKTKTQIKELVEKFGKKIYFSISKDKWHTNKNVDAAKKYLDSIGVTSLVATEEQTRDNSIVPVGRAHLQYISGIYDMMGCYCHNPKHMYSFLIDEDGKIYKCGFGVLSYDTIDDYLEGGFRQRFKEVNTKFYGQFISSCRSCYNFILIQARDRIVKY